MIKEKTYKKYKKLVEQYENELVTKSKKEERDFNEFMKKKLGKGDGDIIYKEDYEKYLKFKGEL